MVDDFKKLIYIYNMHEPWGEKNTKWKKRDPRDHILYNSIYVECPEKWQKANN